MSHDGGPATNNRVVTRRNLATMAGFSIVMVNYGKPLLAAKVADQQGQIVQPALANAKAFMDRAFDMRRLAREKGDQPYGAVIVQDNRIIGQSWSRVIIDSDPTAHAELSAIRDAARRTDKRNLVGAVLYSSSRPCPMCEAAAYWANIQDMIHGHRLQSAGFPKLCG